MIQKILKYILKISPRGKQNEILLCGMGLEF